MTPPPYGSQALMCNLGWIAFFSLPAPFLTLVVELLPLVHYVCEFLRGHAPPGV